MKEKWQKLLRKLKRPKGDMLIILYLHTLVFCGLAIYLAILNSENPLIAILSYVCYGFAGVFLGYTTYTVVIYTPLIKRSITLFIRRFKFGRKMLAEYGFRTIVFASFSVVVNVAFVVYHIVLALITDAFFWYISLATYYGLLLFLRGGIVLYHRKRESGNLVEIKKYRNCGIFLTILPLCLTVPILQVLFLERAFVHEGLSIFAFAAYAFYKIIMAIYNVFRSSKEEALTVQTVRCIGLADALVSIFSLQTALLYAFSEGNEMDYFNAITGIAVVVLTVIIGIYMIVKGQKTIKKQKEKSYE